MENPFEAEYKKIKEATKVALDYSNRGDDIGAKEAWTNVLNQLVNLKNDIDSKKNELISIKEKLQLVESTPVQAAQNISNTDYEGSALKPLQEKIEPNSASLSYDLDILIDRLYKGKLKHNEDKYQESVNKRVDHLAKALADGKFLSGLKNMPKLTDKKSYGEILSEFSRKSSIVSSLKQKESQIEEDSELYRTLKYIRKKQKEKEEKNAVKAVAKFIGGMVINSVVDRVKEVTKTVKTVIKTRMAVSRTGRKILNASTRASSRISSVSGAVKKSLSTTAKVFKYGYDVFDTGSKVTSSAVKAAIPAAAVYLLTGGSGPIAFAYLAGSTTLKSITAILDKNSLSSIKPIRNLQLSHGRGIFYNHNGSLKVDSLKPLPFYKEISGLDANIQDSIIQSAKKIGTNSVVFNKNAPFASTLKNFSDLDQVEIAEKIEQRAALMESTKMLDTRFGRIIRSLDAISTWAPIGAAAATLLGLSPVLGGILAGSTALGIKAIENAIKGGRIPAELLSGALKKSSLLRFLAELPGSEFLDMYQTNQWFATQFDLIKNRYRGDVGAYFRDNWNPFDNSSIFKTALVVSNGLNVLGVGATLASPVAGQFIISKLATPLAKAFPSAVSSTTINGVTKVSIAGLGPRGVMGASLLGSFIGTGIAMLLGVPIGPAMLIGGLIGGGVGTIAGIAISAALAVPTGGLSFLIVTFTTAAGTAIGEWLGSLFDKAVGLSGGAMMNLLQGLMALFQMVSLLTQKFDFSNFVPIALGLITLMATIYKSGILDTSNECLGESCQSKTSASSSINYNMQLIELSSFDIKLLIPSNTQINSDTLAILTTYLKDNGDKLLEKFSNKQLILNLTTNENYSDNELVILGVGNENLYSINSIDTALDKAINAFENHLSIDNGIIGKDFSFLNIAD